MNAIYGIDHSKRKVFLTMDARNWKSTAKMFIPKMKTSTDDHYGISLEFHGNWFFKNGKQKRADLQNLIKLVCDAIGEKLNWDDCQIWKFKAVKIQDISNAVVGTLYKL